MDFKIEVVMLPVSDIDRAKQFYEKMGWRLDADFRASEGDFRVVQFTPPGSACSIAFGRGITNAAKGPITGLELVVNDIETARAEIAGRGIDIGQVYHDSKVIRHADPSSHVAGLDPDHRSYLSYADFTDPDGNQWILQEVTQRAPGR